jgi:hypothetical protein
MCEVEYMLLICASEMGSAEITSLLEKCSPILSHLNNTWYSIIYIYIHMPWKSELGSSSQVGSEKITRL